MTLTIVGHCDAEGCEATFDGSEAPPYWSVVVAPATFSLPGSQHFCLKHADGPAYVAALQAVRA